MTRARVLTRLAPWIGLASVVLLLAPRPTRAKEPEHDLQHGNLQVRRMIADRPAMASVVTRDGSRYKMSRDDPIWKWVANGYGRPIRGAKVDWDGGDLATPKHYLAEHVVPYQNQNGAIRMRAVFQDQHHKVRKSKFEELWAAVVFELINIQGASDAIAVFHRAQRGELSRERWVRLNTEREHGALLKLRAFFRSHFKPWAEKQRVAIDPVAWRDGTPEDYESWIAAYRDAKHDPYTYFGDYWDAEIGPIWRAKQKAGTGKKDETPQSKPDKGETPDKGAKPKAK